MRQLYNEFMHTDAGATITELKNASNRELIIQAAPLVRRRYELANQVELALDKWEHIV
jgi:hypothetical protein